MLPSVFIPLLQLISISTHLKNHLIKWEFAFQLPFFNVTVGKILVEKFCVFLGVMETHLLRRKRYSERIIRRIYAVFLCFSVSIVMNKWAKNTKSHFLPGETASIENDMNHNKLDAIITLYNSPVLCVYEHTHTHPLWHPLALNPMFTCNITTQSRLNTVTVAIRNRSD